MSSSRTLKVYTDETQTYLVFELPLSPNKDKDDAIKGVREKFAVDASTFHTEIDGAAFKDEGLVERIAVKHAFSLKKVKIIPEEFDPSSSNSSSSSSSSTTSDSNGGDERPIIGNAIIFRSIAGIEEVGQVLRCFEFVTSNNTELAMWMTAFINAIEGFYRSSENFELAKSFSGIASSIRDSFVDIRLSHTAEVAEVAELDGNPFSEENERAAAAAAPADAILASRKDRRILGTAKVIYYNSEL